jgi:tetratricopeptide (TPR) repeat protein
MSRPRVVFVCVVLTLVTVLVYLPVRHHAFVNYDDPDYISQNPVVQAGLTWMGIKWAFTTMASANWHPLTWLSLMLDCQLFGLNAGWHHLMSLCFHAVNAALLFVLFARLTGAFWESAFIAALFAWHPLRVESVAWVSERKDVLSAFFGLLTLLAYVVYAQGQSLVLSRKLNGKQAVQRPVSRRSSSNYLLALLFFVLGLIAKPMLVTLPFVFLLLDYWPLQRAPNFELRLSHWWRLIREKWPFFALAAASCVVTYVAQQHGGAAAGLEKYPLSARFENAAVAYAKYLLLSVCPAGLAVVYPLPREIPWTLVIGAILGLAVITGLVWRARASNPYLSVGWLWYLGMLVPVIGVVQVGTQAMADRYTYLPQIGIFIGAVFGLGALAGKLRPAPVVIILIAVFVLAGCLFATARQLRYWQNSETLFEHALAVTTDNFIAENNLGGALNDAGQPREAMEHIRESLRLNPDDASAHDNLGLALAMTGQLQEAIDEYQEALRLQPDSTKARDNLGNALLQTGHPQEAIKAYQEVLRLNPNDASAYHNLGVVFLQTDHPQEAIDYFREALRLQPDDAMTYSSLGVALAQTGQLQEAIKQYQRALQLQPDLPQANCNLGITLTEAGRPTEAIPYLERALQSQPQFLQAHYGLGRAFLRNGQVEEAIRQFQITLQLRPDFTAARDSLGEALLKLTNAPSGPDK